MFRIGQKVVCVDDENFVNYDPSSPSPRKGSLYTIRGFNKTGLVLLEEVIGKPKQFKEFYGEGGYFHWRFRPVVTKSTEAGMSILRGILNGQRAPENA